MPKQNGFVFYREEVVKLRKYTSVSGFVTFPNGSDKQYPLRTLYHQDAQGNRRSLNDLNNYELDQLIEPYYEPGQKSVGRR